MKKILLADLLDREAMDALSNTEGFEITVKTGMNEAELVKTIPGFEAVVVRSATKITAPVIDAAGALKLIVRAGIGLDNIDVKAAKNKGIEVANTPAATSISVAELTMGLMIAAVRNFGKAIVSMKQHKWEKKSLEGTELYGKTLGIIGCGRIGLEVAKRALAFGMNVLLCDIIEVKTDLPLKQVPFPELLAEADIITIHAPKTGQPLISAAELATVKDGVVLINAARGGMIDEEALLEALNSGKVRAAALDVYAKEPPEDFRLVDHPNVVPSPHLGAAAAEGQKRSGFEVVKILKEKLS